MQLFRNAIIASSIVFALSNLYAESIDTLDKKKESTMRLEAGLRTGAAWTISKDSTIIDTADSGGNGAVGAALHFFPIRQFAIDSGIRYRWVGIGYGSSITFQELQVPLSVAYYLPTGHGSNFFIGGGASSLLPTSGVVYRTLGGSANVPIPTADLHKGPSYFLMAGVHGDAFGGSGYYRLEFGFEYAERSLRIFTRDIFMSFEFGLRLFSI